MKVESAENAKRFFIAAIVVAFACGFANGYCHAVGAQGGPAQILQSVSNLWPF